MPPPGLLPGHTVSARVTRIEDYGLYLTTGETQIIVLIPDVSPKPQYPLQRHYDIGQQVRVRLLRWIPDRNQYRGSIAQADVPPATPLAQ